jgi:hypothetical protein
MPRESVAEVAACAALAGSEAATGAVANMETDARTKVRRDFFMQGFPPQEIEYFLNTMILAQKSLAVGWWILAKKSESRRDAEDSLFA